MRHVGKTKWQSGVEKVIVRSMDVLAEGWDL